MSSTFARHRPEPMLGGCRILRACRKPSTWRWCQLLRRGRATSTTTSSTWSCRAIRRHQDDTFTTRTHQASPKQAFSSSSSRPRKCRHLRHLGTTTTGRRAAAAEEERRARGGEPKAGHRIATVTGARPPVSTAVGVAGATHATGAHPTGGASGRRGVAKACRCSTSFEIVARDATGTSTTLLATSCNFVKTSMAHASSSKNLRQRVLRKSR
mmetsp:Transcript_73702/g.210045  ORF Transcript_73702/g.210045 Transcript_73702/m.210045 type:complete len:212 (-) Transcript_73702:744-1379(-)